MIHKNVDPTCGHLCRVLKDTYTINVYNLDYVTTARHSARSHGSAYIRVHCMCMCSKDGNKVYMPQISGQSRSLAPLWYVHVRMLALCACTDAKSLKPHVRFLLSNSTFTRTRLRVTKALHADLWHFTSRFTILLSPGVGFVKASFECTHSDAAIRLLSLYRRIAKSIIFLSLMQ